MTASQILIAHIMAFDIVIQRLGELRKRFAGRESTRLHFYFFS